MTTTTERLAHAGRSCGWKYGRLVAGDGIVNRQFYRRGAEQIEVRYDYHGRIARAMRYRVTSPKEYLDEVGHSDKDKANTVVNWMTT